MNLDDLFRNTQSLPTIPQVVRDLIKSFSDSRVNLAAVSKKIAMDQVLMARTLRLANCARYGLTRKVASIDDAVLILGLDALRTLVVASGLAGAFKAPPGFDLPRFWRTNLATAGYAGWLAKRFGQREDLGFTGGLTLNLGNLLLQLEAAEDCAAIDQAEAAGGRRADLERAKFGFTHADVSAEIAKRWDFPDEIVAAFKVYSEPEAAEPFRPLAAIFFVADRVAHGLLEHDERELLLPVMPRELLARFDENPEVLIAEFPRLQEVLSGLEELLG